MEKKKKIVFLIAFVLVTLVMRNIFSPNLHKHETLVISRSYMNKVSPNSQHKELNDTKTLRLTESNNEKRDETYRNIKKRIKVVCDKYRKRYSYRNNEFNNEYTNF